MTWFRIDETKRVSQGKMFILRYTIPSGMVSQSVRTLEVAKSSAELLAKAHGVDVRVSGQDADGEFEVAIATAGDRASQSEDALLKGLYQNAIENGITLHQELLEAFDPDAIKGFAQMATAMNYFAIQFRRLGRANQEKVLGFRTLQQALCKTNDFNLITLGVNHIHLAFLGAFLDNHPAFTAVAGVVGLGSVKTGTINNRKVQATSITVDGKLTVLNTKPCFVGTLPSGNKFLLSMIRSDEGYEVIPRGIAIIAALEDVQPATTWVKDLLRQTDPMKNRLLYVSAASGYGGGFEYRIFTSPPNSHTWHDVVPDESAYQELQLLTSSVQMHDKLKAEGLTMKRGVLISGPPGVGKSASLGAFMNALKGQVTIVVPESISDMRELYNLAQTLSPSVVILEDLDLITIRRDHQPARDSATGELLQVLSGTSEYPDIITIATTNFPDKIDEALSVRPGRFDNHIRVDAPSKEQKMAILDLYIEKFHLQQEIADGVRALFSRELRDLPLVGAHIEEFITVGVKRATLQDRPPIMQDFQQGVEGIKTVALKKNVPVGFQKN